MPRLWTRIAGSLGLLTLAVLVFNAGVFWVVLEQAAVKRQTDLAASLGQAMGAQLGAAVRKGAEPDDLAAAVEAVGEGRLDMEQLVLVDARLNVLTAVVGEAPGRVIREYAPRCSRRQTTWRSKGRFWASGLCA